MYFSKPLFAYLNSCFKYEVIIYLMKTVLESLYIESSHIYETQNLMHKQIIDKC